MTDTPDKQRIIELAAQTVERAFIGVFSTVDAEGRPRSRHMAAVADNGQLQRLFSLTATETRKVHEIQHNPAVCWLFADHDYQHIVRLTGQAGLMSTSNLQMSLWTRLIDYADAYVTTELRDKEHFAFHVVVTQIETLEFLAPDMGLVTPHPIDLT